MLFLWPGTSTLLRGQGTYLSDEEINRVVEHCSTGEQNFVQELMHIKVNDEEGEQSDAKPKAFKKRDELYEAAVDIVVREGRGSCSLLQRALGIGYGRAARLIDFMADDGIVGQYNGSQAREVTISINEWETMRGGEAPVAAQESNGRKNNKIRRDEGWDETPSPNIPNSSRRSVTLPAAVAASAATALSVAASSNTSDDEVYEDDYEEEEYEEAEYEEEAGDEEEGSEDEYEYEDAE